MARGVENVILQYIFWYAQCSHFIWKMLFDINNLFLIIWVFKVFLQHQNLIYNACDMAKIAIWQDMIIWINWMHYLSRTPSLFTKEQRKIVFDKRKLKPKLRFVFWFLLDWIQNLNFLFLFCRTSLSTWSLDSLSTQDFRKNFLL